MEGTRNRRVDADEIKLDRASGDPCCLHLQILTFRAVAPVVNTLSRTRPTRRRDVPFERGEVQGVILVRVVAGLVRAGDAPDALGSPRESDTEAVLFVLGGICAMPAGTRGDVGVRG